MAQHIVAFQNFMNSFSNKMMRNDESYSKKGIKEDWWHYCSIPPVIEMELLKKGLNLNNKDDHKAIFREINANYPYLKSTDKRHA
jgi:hypothetical protein